MNLMDRQVYGIALHEWIVAAVISAALALLFYIVQRILVRRLPAWVGKTATRLDDYAAEILSATRLLFLFIAALYFGLQYLSLPAKAARLVDHVAAIALLVQVALWGNRGIAMWIADYMQRHRDTDAAGAATMSVLGVILRVAVWSVLVLMMLDSLGFNITTLAASLGIGGVAVALAVQNILGDIFSSLSIALDKPFVIGDFITVDDHLGTVEYIGLKTTRIRSLSGEQIVFSNSDLLKSRIRNYKRMYERRIVFGFGVTYRTPLEKLEQIPHKVKEILAAQKNVRFDRAHFKEFGDSALNFEVVYIVQNPDFNLYMDIQQEINLALFRWCQQEQIDFAYPTRTLYWECEAGTIHA